MTGEMKLTTEKMDRLQTLLKSWGNKKACSCKELQSLIGVLNHACKVANQVVCSSVA